MAEGSTSRKSLMAFQENMRGYVATFLLATAVVLMVTLGLLVVVLLASSGDEKEHTSNDGLNKDISDLLERDAPAAEQNTDTPPGKLTTPTTTRRSPRPPPSSPTSRSPATTPTTTTARKTTRKAPRRSLLAGSLLCTLGVIHFSDTYIYPVDGLCDLITFDSLFVPGGGVTLSPPYNKDFNTFLTTASGHRLTEYAIGIDHNFCRNHNLMSDLVGNPTAKETLNEMWSQRIHHYGQVNTPVMEASGNPLEYVTQSARGLQMISQLMRNKADSEGQPSYTILHYPMMYESMAAGVAKALTSYPVDILVAIGYTSYSDYGTKDCRMVPPVLHSEELLEPSLLNTSYPVRLVRVLSAMWKFKKEQAATSAIAVSFGMGGRWYTPKDTENLPDVPGNYSLGEPCTTSSQGAGPEGRQITSIAEACKKPNYKSAFRYDETFQAQVSYDKSENMLFTFDNSASIRYKLYDTEGIVTDLHYNLAADNIQYEDFANVCRQGQFSRLRFMKTLVPFTSGTHTSPS